MSEQGASGGEQMRMPTVPEVVLSSAQLLISLAADAIGRRQDLDQAQIAIDAVDGLLPTVGRLVPADELRQYRRAVSDLQLAYAEAVAAPPESAAPAEQPGPAEPAVETPPRPPIWTPGGDV